MTTTIREQLEQREREILARQAAKSADSRGRLRAEAEDSVRPAFQRDRDRIIHCKAFRRLKHKTQVFFRPTGDHYRTRLTHTLEVSQIARTIAKVLRLLAVEPPEPSTAHMALRFPPVAQFVERWRSLLRRRSRVDFEQEVAGYSRVEVAVAFLALLDLSKQGELELAQAAPFAPIRISRPDVERRTSWNVRSA